MTVLPPQNTRYRGWRLLIVLTAVGVLLPHPNSARASLRIVRGGGDAKPAAILLGGEFVADLSLADRVSLPLGPLEESSSEPVSIEEGSWQGLNSHRRVEVSPRRFARVGALLRPPVGFLALQVSARRLPPLVLETAHPLLPVLLCRWTC